MSTVWPEDLGDCFCDLWDAYRLLWRLDTVETWTGDDRFHEAVHDLAAQCLELQKVPSSSRKSVNEPYGAFKLALAIDRALRHVNPLQSSAESARALPELAVRYASSGRLNKEAKGALLPRWVLPTRLGGADLLAECFTSVTRVAPNVWASTRLHVDELSALGAGPVGGLIAACVPVADDLSEFAISRIGDVFALEPSERLASSTLMADALDALDRSGADVGVLPQAVLTEESLRQWSKLLQGTPPPRESRLRWIMAGSGPCSEDSGIRNRAALISRDGKELMFQDKRHRFTMNDDTIESWCLRGLLGEGPLREDICPEAELSVVETLAGRFIIFICEGLDRNVGQGEHILQVSPSHILAPVFDRELLRRRWNAAAAESWLLDGGARTVIANSLAVLRARQARGTCEPDAWSAAVVYPAGAEGEVGIDGGLATGAEAVVCLGFPPLG